MAINIIAFPPGGGGNHLRNLCDLDGRFRDQWPWSWVAEQYIGIGSYDRPPGSPGDVHSLPGRNVREVFVNHVTNDPRANYFLHGHFGELATYAAQIRTWPKVRWLVQTLDTGADRYLLRARQTGLGYHPYWLDEEQIYLYQPSMYQHYFGASPALITCVSVKQVWSRDIRSSGVLDCIAMAFGIRVDPDSAQILHTKWCDLNFGPVGV